MAKKSFFKADHRSAVMHGTALAFEIAAIGFDEASSDKENEK
jgi:hypothetical protein